MSGTGLSERTARQDFVDAQQQVLDRYGVVAESRLVSTPLLQGDTHVLVAGEGPPVMMVIGGGMVGGLWAPLMARLHGFTLYALDPPGHGLTATMEYQTESLRRKTVEFLTQVLDGLGLEAPPFVAQSIGGLWTSWLAMDRPERVSSISYVACPAMILGTSAPVALRISTIPWVRSILDRVDPPSERQVTRMTRRAGEDFSHLPELRDLFLAYGRLPETARSLLDLHRSVVRLRGARPETALTATQLAGISQPVQMIWGESDPFGPPTVGERAAQVLPQARLHVVPGGHGPWFNGSHIVAPLIDGFIRLNT